MKETIEGAKRNERFRVERGKNNRVTIAVPSNNLRI